MKNNIFNEINEKITFERIAIEWSLRKTAGYNYSYIKEIENSVAHLNGALGNRCINEITWIDVENILLSRARCNPNTQRPASRKLLSDIKNTASSIFEYAIDKQLIEKNPVHNRKLPKCKDTTERRALSDKEQKLILCTEHRGQLSAVLMMLAGLRTGELIPLTWNDYDKEKQILNINKSVYRSGSNKYELKPGTKNKKNRTVPIPAKLTKFLKEAEKKASSCFITSKKDGTMHTPSSWVQLWGSYRTHLNYFAYEGNRSYFSPKGIPQSIEKITPHMLRHTYATLLYSSGVDVLTASKLLGHSDIKTTLGIYTHLEELTEEKSIDKFDEYITKQLSF